MKRLLLRLALAAGAFAPVVLLAADAPVTAAAPDTAWDAVFDRTDGWIGGDAIYSTPLPGGNVLWLFADTFIGRVRDGHRQPGVRMVNNTLARHALGADGAPPGRAALQFLWGTPPDSPEPTAWITPDPALQSSKGEASHWYWVADAITAPGHAGRERLIVFLWRMARSGNEVMGFRGVGNALAIIDDAAADWSTWRPKQFTITHAVPNSAEDKRRPEIVWGSEVLLVSEADGRRFLVIFGYRQPLRLAMQLVAARVPPDAVEQMDAWEFRTSGGWSSSLADAVSLAQGLTTEFSVSRIDSPTGPRWVLVQSEPSFGRHIFARTSRSPFGPWSPPKPVYQVPGVDAKKRHFTYSAKAHPELSRAGELLVSYVVNSLDFGEAVNNADIYRPRFIRVPAVALPEPLSAAGQ